jgi:hypothetical protein
MSDETQPIKKDLPKTYKDFVGKFPAIGEAHEKVAKCPFKARQG